MPEFAQWSASSPARSRGNSSRATRTPTFWLVWPKFQPWWLGLLLEKRTLPVLEFLPVLAGETVDVVDHLALSHGHLGNDSLRGGFARHRGVEDAEVAFLHTQDRDIGFSAHIQIAELRALDLLRRRPGGHTDYVGDRGPQCKNARHRVIHRLQSAVHAVGVQVGRDGVRLKPRRIGRHRDVPVKAGLPEAEVEDDL